MPQSAIKTSSTIGSMAEKITIAMVFMLILILGYQVAPSAGFIPNKQLAMIAKTISYSLEDAITHEEMTRNSILEVADEVLRDSPNPSDSLGSSRRLSALLSLDEESLITAYYGQNDQDRIEAFKNAIEAVVKANSGVDFGGEKDLAAAHFDSEQLENGQYRLINLRQSVLSSIMVGDFIKARQDTGRFLHALQDFYSHTNWIENGNRAPYHVLGRPNQRIANIASPTQQTCRNCELRKKFGLIRYYECRDNIDQRLKMNGILTSGYGDDQTDNEGRVIQKPRGKCSHGGVTDTKRDTFATGGINKDGPYFRTSPHHYLYAEAVAVAQQATADMFRDVRRVVNNDQLFGAYLGVFLSQADIESMGNLPMRSQTEQLLVVPEVLLQYATQINSKYM